MASKFRIAAWVAIGAITGIMATLQVQALARGAASPLPLEELQQFAAVYGLIKADYFEPIEGKKLIENAINGMVNNLDPHSEYLDKKAFKDFKESTSGKFVGVGIEIAAEDGLVKVVAPIEGSPAARAGIHAGDLITRIDNTAVKGLSLNDAVKLMRGKPGTKVTLTVLRKAENRTLTFTITRELIQVQSVKSKMLAPGYGWIRITQFQADTLPSFVNKINALYKEDPNMKGLILDLRNDPGGLLESAVGVASVFLPNDAVIVSTKGQMPEANATYRNTPSDYLSRPGDNPLDTLPAAVKTVKLVVLINGGSASASEIVTGALQDYKRAVVMGTLSFGKGSVQTVLPLGPDTALKLTTARYYTPNGQSIQGKGITPNYEVDPLESGDPYAALRMREIDYKNQIGTGNEAADSKRVEEDVRKQEEARRLLEAELQKDPNKLPKLPEYASKDDWQVTQALNYLEGKPVITAKHPASTAKTASTAAAASSPTPAASSARSK
ncbi:S41 family peptidase [Thiomonas sp.]|uniref:S41 family peptidase n=1 Tax=Thiomonas sp. TaxID=2047785 RepID=UPI0026093BE7|nr:S41 family peptidase [Thiomonas sp.]